jgi:hypothetical protein
VPCDFRPDAVDVLRGWLAPVRPAVTQAEVARAGGLSRQYVCDVLHGRRPLTARLVAALAVVGLPAGELYASDGGGEADR